MFRELTRSKQQLSREECIRLLVTLKRGVLSVLGDDGYPYGMPLNHFYCEEDGKIYFHSGRRGHKIDALRRCGKVSYCVYDEGYRDEGDWALHINSVIVFGSVEFIEDREKI
ncbi:MAG: pyridoxamine 5'-phosphate oxidase family protein, partial [Clostridia bacterium]|nr:pyridoxamine 5'-phosphate oxidase family protein [Clostridia bacterium]